jgi:hypothetical protein
MQKEGTYGFYVPNPNRRVVRCGRQVQTVRRPCDIGQALLMTSEVADEFTREGVPYFDEIVVRCSSQ